MKSKIIILFLCLASVVFSAYAATGRDSRPQIGSDSAANTSKLITKPQFNADPGEPEPVSFFEKGYFSYNSPIFIQSGNFYKNSLVHIRIATERKPNLYGNISNEKNRDHHFSVHSCPDRVICTNSL